MQTRTRWATPAMRTRTRWRLGWNVRLLLLLALETEFPTEAFFPQTALLALAVGGVARELGARRSWPLAAYLTLLLPTVIRWAATQYVDILVGAGIAAACHIEGGLDAWRKAGGAVVVPG